MKVRVFVRLKSGVLDPQGETIRASLHRLGFPELETLRAGKFFEMELDMTDPEEARQRTAAMCESLLANPVIEEYDIEIEGY